MRPLLAWLAALVCTAALGAEPPVRLAVPGLQGVNVSAESLSFYSEHLAQNLRAPGLIVVTAREVSTLLGLERQKQLLGCGEGADSCMAELANALGADGVVVGDIARFGDTFQVNVKVLAAADAAVMAAHSARVDGEVPLLDALGALARRLSVATFVKKGRVPPAELTREPEARLSRKWAFLPLGVGAASAVAGGALVLLARSDYDALVARSGAPLADADARALRDAGATKQTAGGVLLAVGATALVAGGVMLLLGQPEPPTIAVVPGPHGAGVVVTGVWP